MSPRLSLQGPPPPLGYRFFGFSAIRVRGFDVCAIRVRTLIGFGREMERRGPAEGGRGEVNLPLDGF